MIRKSAAAAVLSVAGLLSIGLTAASASAAPVTGAVAATARSTPHTKAWVAQQVRGLLAHNPGAKQVSASAVQVRGAIIGISTGPAGRAVPHSASGWCSGGDVCLFRDQNFNGDSSSNYYISFYQCGIKYNLWNYHMSNGVAWGDQASSIDNPQYGSVTSRFYHGSSLLFTLAAGHYLKDLANDTGPHNGSMNDWITYVTAC